MSENKSHQSFTRTPIGSMNKALQPIGVFDSGLGGLTIVRQIRRRLPCESVIYFGDLARLPYGTKSKEQITRYSIQNAEFLLRRRVKAIVVACNSSSSAAHSILKRLMPVPVIDMIGPASAEAVSMTQSKRIGVIATQATVETGAYEKNLKRLASVEVFSTPCPFFVPMVEEGYLEGPITDQIVRHYLEPLKSLNIDVLMLGCTHYPMLKSAIQKFMSGTLLVDSAKASVEKLASTLSKLRLSYPHRRAGVLKVFVSDKPRNFISLGERFLGEKLGKVSVIRNDE